MRYAQSQSIHKASTGYCLLAWNWILLAGTQDHHSMQSNHIHTSQRDEQILMTIDSEQDNNFGLLTSTFLSCCMHACILFTSLTSATSFNYIYTCGLDVVVQLCYILEVSAV